MGRGNLNTGARNTIRPVSAPKAVAAARPAASVTRAAARPASTTRTTSSAAAPARRAPQSNSRTVGGSVTFQTKLWKDRALNGQSATITRVHNTKDGPRYDLKFSNGKTRRNVYDNELR